jgi:hypothetical protein
VKPELDREGKVAELDPTMKREGRCGARPPALWARIRRAENLVITKLGLTLNEVKTKDARAKHFGFLAFAPYYHRKQGYRKIRATASISSRRQLVSC